MMQDPVTSRLVSELNEACRGLRSARLMEVCGTHTMALFRNGVKSLLPPAVRLISGPGCPVCVTAQGYIDAACELASRPGVVICTYGDMVRVPGRSGSLERQRARGAQVAVVYSARDAVRYARRYPDRKVVFLAVGFETTAPATAAAVIEAERKDLNNFFILAGHKLVVPAMAALLSEGEGSQSAQIDGFLCPGHVSVVIGSDAFRPVVEDHHSPCVVAGFEPQQLLLGILQLVRQVAAGQARLENVYDVAVAAGGNQVAVKWLEEVFEPATVPWRAIGRIPDSGLELRERYRRFDAGLHFGLGMEEDYDPPGCRCGQVIQGKVEPIACPLFGTSCTPMNPIGPCMVSSEGTCAAWYKYNRSGTEHAQGMADDQDEVWGCLKL